MQSKTISCVTKRPSLLPLRLSAIVAGFMLAATPVMAQPAPPPSKNPAHITVYATGTANAAPDTALLSLAVSSQAATARDALNQTNIAMAKVIAAVKAAGVAEADMQTMGLNIQPHYESDRTSSSAPKQQGYEANNILSVKIRDLGKLGPVLDDAVANGANGLSQMTLTNDNLQPLYDEAHKNAVINAIAKAKLLAEAAGDSVGKVLRIDEKTSSIEPMARMAYASATAPTIALGKNSYNVNISVTMELLNRK